MTAALDDIAAERRRKVSKREFNARILTYHQTRETFVEVTITGAILALAPAEARALYGRLGEAVSEMDRAEAAAKGKAT